MSLNRELRAKLLAKARERCCLHRRLWLRVVPENQLAVKWERLDVHHVKFQSCGGGDAEENLVPLCPNCHTTLHAARRCGDEFLTDGALLEMWKQWKGFADIVPASLLVGDGPPVQFVTVALTIYGLKVKVEFDAETTYANFRARVLGHIVDPLRLQDPHFPFLRKSEGWEWQLSCDDSVSPPWNHTTAAVALAERGGELTLGCPTLVLLTQNAHWLSSFRDHHRWL